MRLIRLKSSMEVLFWAHQSQLGQFVLLGHSGAQPTTIQTRAGLEIELSPSKWFLPLVQIVLSLDFLYSFLKFYQI